jgi:hypothetical protein
MRQTSTLPRAGETPAPLPSLLNLAVLTACPCGAAVPAAQGSRATAGGTPAPQSLRGRRPDVRAFLRFPGDGRGTPQTHGALSATLPWACLGRRSPSRMRGELAEARAANEPVERLQREYLASPAATCACPRPHAEVADTQAVTLLGPRLLECPQHGVHACLISRPLSFEQLPSFRCVWCWYGVSTRTGARTNGKIENL